MPQADRLVEPFAGSAAITLAAAARNRYARFLISDALEPLAGIWQLVLTDPERLCDRYQDVWVSQLDNPRRFYDEVRREFNNSRDPALLLYLLARCVKASVRFNPRGDFNQSPDNRRLGMKPNGMRREVMGAHRLLAGRTEVSAADFRDTLSRTVPGDVVYLDPPYQGISEGRDRRYYRGVQLGHLVSELRKLNASGIPFVLSYDGTSGQRRYGRPLPDSLQVTRIALPAGRSSQSTLSGRAELTIESLYISPWARSRLGLRPHGFSEPAQLPLYR
jgi:DNA adenine methylase